MQLGKRFRSEWWVLGFGTTGSGCILGFLGAAGRDKGLKRPMRWARRFFLRGLVLWGELIAARAVRSGSVTYGIVVILSNVLRTRKEIGTRVLENRRENGVVGWVWREGGTTEGS